ncbi:hypothetical protein C8R47DRAFT_1124169 [Mycena vitilis]|nr:hypothetical protein C8R47DRAFT_1124169 [Mycena vitilis]
MSSAMSSTQVQAQQTSQDDREDGEEEEEEFPHSKLYAPFIREIIEYIRLNLPHLISPEDDSPTDALELELFETFSGECHSLRAGLWFRVVEHTIDEAQMLLTCLLMRKDMKWQTSWRLEKLGDRLELRDGKLERVIAELCTIPETSPHLTGLRCFAQDESTMTNEDRLRCLRVDHLHQMLGDSRRTRKSELILALQQSDHNIWDQVNQILGKSIRISEHVIRLFRRLVLTYYWCERRNIKRAISEGPPSPRLDIMEGVGKRCGVFTPMMYCDPPFSHKPPFVSSLQALVGFEERRFPILASLKLAAVDNYLLIFNDILAHIEDDDNTNITEACYRLDDATRHVLGSIVMQRSAGVSSADLLQWRSVGVFEPEKENVTATVIAKLCGSAAGDFAFCTDETHEPFKDVLKRLRKPDLQEIATKHSIKPKGAKSKANLIAAFMRALPQRRLNTPLSLQEILMPDVIAKLDVLEKRTLRLKANVLKELKALVKSYFQSQPEAPAHIAQKPFREMRQRCLGLK